MVFILCIVAFAERYAFKRTRQSCAHDVPTATNLLSYAWRYEAIDQEQRASGFKVSHSCEVVTQFELGDDQHSSSLDLGKCTREPICSNLHRTGGKLFVAVIPVGTDLMCGPAGRSAT